MTQLFRTLQAKLAGIRQKSLVKDSAWMLLAQGSSIFIQAAYFVILARVLGTEDYGIFVGVAALAAVVGPFAGLGSPSLLVKNVSRDRTLLSVYWGNALLLTAVSSLILILGCLLLAPRIFPDEVSALLILLIFAADLIGLRVIDVASAAFLATDQVKRTAQLKIVLSVTKLLAAVGLLVFFQSAGIWAWAVLYSGSTLLAALLAALMVTSLLGAPSLSIQRLKDDLLEGLNFSVSASAHSINVSMDRTMLASLSTLQATGIYGAGMRFIEVCAFPIVAIQGSTYARFFQAGVEGVKGSWAFGRRLLPAAFAYGLGIGLVLFLLAPFTPWVIGDEYQDAISLIRLMAVMPLLWTLQFITSDTLTGAGFQGFVSSILVTSSAVNIGLNFYLIPLYSWQGAAWATLTSESFKLLVTLGAIAYLFQQQQKNSPRI